jgi:hypothetical protein
MTEHGTRSRYMNEGCRCEPCKTANSEYELARGEVCLDCGEPCSPNSKRCKPCYLSLSMRPKDDGFQTTQFPCAGRGENDVAKESSLQHSPESVSFGSPPCVFGSPTKFLRQKTKVSSWQTF